ncbi:ATP-binding cassette domain-containing protein [Cytophagales bacterium LB-30]|uniref:ATP-binding cassette domain-containing protein n=1 Tax=Shiella aurantiaca TaxID=3058365 RepID=A0ABT8F824_9BACT|nr:ATP-binding cassette domain-containing protein [Shiella aurantiaca]MDN4166394.1 ATP-binding cassette domain-containing protein [Shiella aurantiaca]
MEHILSASHISKRYAQHHALNDVSIAIPKGSIFGLLGPNGAGKTTLIRIITQIITADEGQILFNGEPLQPKHVPLIGYLPEERGLYKKMKVGEQLVYLGQLRGLSHKEASDKSKFWVKKLEIADWWSKKVEDLSKGMAQKIQFIATVMHEPELIILDEPFSGFDPINANLIRDEILQLRKKGCTIIFSTHRMETVEDLCDSIALINKSEKILDGTKREIKEAYRNNTFLLHCQGSVASNGIFDVLSEKNEGENHFSYQLKLKEGHSANELLNTILPQVQIQSFSEKIPSINEIFITKVGGDKS